MTRDRRLVLLRHGETTGGSSIRYYGARNVWLSETGHDQARAARHVLDRGGFDLAVASTLQRAWKFASIVVPGLPIRLEPDFREIDFGRWEGLTAEEIEAREPDAYAEWQKKRMEFNFPEGEPRAEFRARVRVGLTRMLAEDFGARGLVVSHMGVVRTIFEELVGEALDPGFPQLGTGIEIEATASGRWRIVA